MRSKPLSCNECTRLHVYQCDGCQRRQRKLDLDEAPPRPGCLATAYPQDQVSFSGRLEHPDLMNRVVLSSERVDGEPQRCGECSRLHVYQCEGCQRKQRASVPQRALGVSTSPHL
eukprot:gene7647-7127_t